MNLFYDSFLISEFTEDKGHTISTSLTGSCQLPSELRNRGAKKEIASRKDLPPLTFGTLSLSQSTDQHYLSVKEKGSKSSKDQVNSPLSWLMLQCGGVGKIVILILTCPMRDVLQLCPRISNGQILIPDLTCFRLTLQHDD